MLRKKHLSIGIALCLLLSCTEEQDNAVDEPVVNPSVELYAIVDSPQREIISSVGTVRFRRETALGFTTSGKISSVRFNEGDRVKRGEMLAALDSTNVRADISLAAAELDRARSENDRIETLFTQGWVTKSRLEQSRANYQAAQARIEQAKFASDTSRLLAPSAGIIISRNIDPGQIVSAGESALVFGQIDSGYILRVPLTALNAAKVSVGMPVNISISSIENELFAATISEIDGRADDQTGSFFAIVALPFDSRFRSGQIGTANFTIASTEKIIEIPSDALSGMRASEGIIYIYEPSTKRVAIRNVTLGPLNDKKIVIRSGLSVGEQIVLRGHEKLSDGINVNIISRGSSDKTEPKSVTAKK